MAENEKNVPEMDEYEPDIVDLDGEPFEIIDFIEYEGDNYLALVPYEEDLDDSDEEIEFVILKEIEQDDEYTLATIDDDELYNKIGDMFIEKFESIFEDMDEE